MKFCLVEPLFSMVLEDRPSLGCAMIIAACEKEGIDCALVHGQTEYLRDLFVENSEEAWDLVGLLSKDDIEGVKRKGGEIGRKLMSLDKMAFKDKLSSLYQRLFLDRNVKNYFDSDLITTTQDAYMFLVNIYSMAMEKGMESIGLVDRYVERILAFNPDAVGFSIYRKFDPLSRLIRQKIRNKSPRTPLIVGGSITVFLDKEGLLPIFKKEVFDYLVIGAGDNALPALLTKLNQKALPHNVDNIGFMCKEKIVVNEVKVVADINKLPFPSFSQFHLDRYIGPYRILPLLSARGCTYRKCAFCTHYSLYMDSYKTNTLKRVAETISFLKKEHRCRHFVFHDEELPPNRVKIICQTLIENGFKDISLYGTARFEKGFDDESLLNLMCKAGFAAIEWGLESGSQKVLNLMGKGTNVEMAGKILKNFRKKGIFNLCFIMFGFPGEEREDAIKTVNFLKRHFMSIDAPLTGVFRLDCHSPVYGDPGRYGIVLLGDDRYEVRTGMGQEESRGFFGEFKREWTLNNIIVTSPLTRFLATSLNKRMQLFTMSSQGLLPHEKARDILKQNMNAQLFPIIFGKFHDDRGKTMFSPIDVSESPLINRYSPPDNLTINPMEKEIIRLSDGSRNVGQIIEAAARHSAFKDEAAKSKGICFFERILKNRKGLFFQKRWKTVKTSNRTLSHKEKGKRS